MLSLFPLLGLIVIIPTIVSGKPVQNGKDLRRLDMGIAKRQDDDGEDIDPSAATDELREAFDYASKFSAQATATYSAVSIGAAPSDAALVATTSQSPGSNPVGSPPDPKEQGPRYVVDHIVELQFVVGAFRVNPRPTTGTTSIPLDRWNSASDACFSKTPDFPAQTSVASAFAQTFNLQGIPSRFNGFKQQVFTGRFKSQPNNPSDRTYPSDFGPALQKFLTENEQDAYSVLDDIGKALANENVGNYTAIRDYFTAYAQNEYRSAVDFLSTWVGTSYTTAPATSTRSTTATSNATPAPPANPTCDCGESSCSEDSPPCCANGSCDLDGTCDTPNCD